MNFPIQRIKVRKTRTANQPARFFVATVDSDKWEEIAQSGYVLVRKTRQFDPLFDQWRHDVSHALTRINNKPEVLWVRVNDVADIPVRCEATPENIEKMTAKELAEVINSRIAALNAAVTTQFPPTDETSETSGIALDDCDAMLQRINTFLADEYKLASIRIVKCRTQPGGVMLRKVYYARLRPTPIEVLMGGSTMSELFRLDTEGTGAAWARYGDKSAKVSADWANSQNYPIPEEVSEADFLREILRRALDTWERIAAIAPVYHGEAIAKAN